MRNDTTPCFPPADWKPPQSPIAYDCGAGYSAGVRVVGAMMRILETRGPMTADVMTAMLVINGYGPLIDEMDGKPEKPQTPSRKPASQHQQESFNFS